MVVQTVLFLINMVLINAAFLLSFLIRYGLLIPQRSILPYKNNFVFLTLIYMSALSFWGTYKSRFKSSWDLFQRVFRGLFLGTLISIVLVYVFRIEWGAFPTSIFVLSFFINLFWIFKLNQLVLKFVRRIRKKVAVIGSTGANDIAVTKADIESTKIDDIEQLIKNGGLDEIIICDSIQDEKLFNLLIFLIQRSKINVLFAPSIYMKLMPEKITGQTSVISLGTLAGRKRDIDEFLIRGLDIVGSILILFVSLPLTGLFSLLIRLSSPGPVLYKQQRVGKDGEIFTLYKFRTMVKDAEQVSGLMPAVKNDPRVTGLGRLLRRTRLDELPQLLNVIKGQMSLVGPRPENLYRVRIHKALQGARLAVKPGITGLAQIRSFYDLHPRHKIRYDYLYIQRRSLLLNLYILFKTVPVVLLKKGW
jgi:lipopolysaccharide/colanic/teichoic acid biosynthesis glycosyltransferase